MSAALHASALGMDVLIVEASDRLGGSTAISGGVVWVPNNPQLPSRGIADSREDALAYLMGITKGEIAADRIEAYVDGALRMIEWMQKNTWLKLDALEEYCDYYPEAPGGKRGGRSMEPVPFDASTLGRRFELLRDPHPQSQVMGKFGISAREAKGFVVPTWAAKFRLLWKMIRYALRAWKRRGHRRDTLLYAGNALIGRLFRSLLEGDTTIWMSSPARKLLRDGTRITGARIERDGGSVAVSARFGVLLAAGGFEQNQAMRTEHHTLGRSDIEWNSGNPHNQGQGITMGQAVGGAVALMDEAWWTPVTRVPRSDPAWVLVVEKSLPGSILVNRHAERFFNEAAPYIDVVKAMYAHDAVPTCWLIFDAEFRRRYPVGPVAPGYAQPDRTLSRRLRDGFLKRAATLEELADLLELDVAALRATVDRFNELADAGVDTDFGRGESLADRYYGDDARGKNPSLAALRKAPWYAIPVFPGDLATKGGLVTDARARVLDAEGRPIPGLYAAGNTSASMMGPTYPGAGGTIGPALTFGFLAAETAVEDFEQPEASPASPAEAAEAASA
jgi:3-oxosteroid 1-dehydrogenase